MSDVSPATHLYIQRQVRAWDQLDGSADMPLSDLRDRPAYVLLGDPGAGKTRAMQHEAACTPRGRYLRAVELAQGDTLSANEILFIDALDEARAGAGDAFDLLNRLLPRLRDAGIRQFRVSCRESDWFAQADQRSFASLAADGQLTVCHLLPLRDEDLANLILSFGGANPNAFIDKANQAGLAELLRNPMTTKLLVKAVGHQWPNSKTEVYELACQQLVTEPNAEHRARKRKQSPLHACVLAAAAELCALLLLSAKSAIDMVGEPTAPDVISFLQLPLGLLCSTEDHRAALGTRIFSGMPEHDSCFSPVHRTVAEFLAAKHLRGQLQGKLHPPSPPLPVRRLMALSSVNGRVVSSLRGVNAWLATLDAEHRSSFIEADPLGVALYADATQFTTQDKQELFDLLAQEAGQTPRFRMGQWQQSPAAGLATADMQPYFSRLISAPTRDPSHLALLDLIFDCLRSSGELIGLESQLVDFIRDSSAPPEARDSALAAWLSGPLHAEVSVRLLDELASGDLRNRELVRRLIVHLHPDKLDLTRALRYMPAPDQTHSSRWHREWVEQLVQKAPDDQLSSTVEALLVQRSSGDPDPKSLVPEVAPCLLHRLLTLCGETAQAQQLCRWLELGLYRDHAVVQSQWRDSDSFTAIQTWLTNHPVHYKNAVAHLLSQTPWDDPNTATSWLEGLLKRLLEAPPPADFGRWYLDQARSRQQPALLKDALKRAATWLQQGIACDGLSIEFIESWCKEVSQQHAEVSPWFEHAFSSNLEKNQDFREAHRHKRNHKRARQIQFERNRSKWLPQYRKHMAQLKAGTASLSLVNQIASTWAGRFSDVVADTPKDRLTLLLDGDVELVEAAADSLRRVHLRSDLPDALSILATELENQRMVVADTCLMGAELELQQSPQSWANWSDDTAARLLAAHFTRGMGEASSWFDHLVDSQPDLVASIYQSHAIGRIRTGHGYLHLAHRLTRELALAPIAARVLLPILQAWPARSSADQQNLRQVLHDAAWAYLLPDDMRLLADERLAIRTLDPQQRVHWLTVRVMLSQPSSRHCAWQALLAVLSKSAAARAEFSGLSQLEGMRTQMDALPVSERNELWRTLARHMAPEPYPRDCVTSWLTGLAGQVGPTAFGALQDWLTDSSLQAWHATVRALLYQQRALTRDSQYQPMSMANVARTLQGSSPANAPDLQALVLEQLNRMAGELRGGNTGLWKNFWDFQATTKGALDPEPIPKLENDCRDQIKQFLDPRLSRLGIAFDKEAAQVDEGRCDLQASHLVLGSEPIKLPIEIKRAWHADLWSAAKTQLIDRYALTPEAEGCGIYLVLWFGGLKTLLKPHPHRLPINGPQDLRQLLETSLPEIDRHRIQIVVLDVSPHGKAM